MEHRILRSSYIENLDKFVSDLIRYDDLIDKWKVNHPEYDVFVEADIDDGLYTITVTCRKRLGE